LRCTALMNRALRSHLVLSTALVCLPIGVAACDSSPVITRKPSTLIIKLGGSAITEKSKFETLKGSALKAAAVDIQKAYASGFWGNVIVVHGAGMVELIALVSKPHHAAPVPLTRFVWPLPSKGIRPKVWPSRRCGIAGLAQRSCTDASECAEAQPASPCSTYSPGSFGCSGVTVPLGQNGASK
jgi:hypothetical protein